MIHEIRENYQHVKTTRSTVSLVKKEQMMNSTPDVILKCPRKWNTCAGAASLAFSPSPAVANWSVLRLGGGTFLGVLI